MCPSYIAQTEESYLISEEALVSSWTAAASAPGEAVSERHRIAMVSVYRTWLRKSREHGCGRADVSLAPSLALWLSETDNIFPERKDGHLEVPSRFKAPSLPNLLQVHWRKHGGFGRFCYS